MSLRCISIVLGAVQFLHLRPLAAAHQQVLSGVVPPVSENQSVELTLPAVTTSTVSTLKRNDWWPPSAQDVVTQTSPYHPTQLQQSAVPPIYYSPGNFYYYFINFTS